MNLHGRPSARPVRSKDEPVRLSSRRGGIAKGYMSDDDSGRGKGAGRTLPPPALFSFLCACAYGVASLAMVFLNKGVLQTYKYSMTLLTLQMAAAAALLQIGHCLGILKVRAFDLRTARKLLPLAFFYTANVACALASLAGVNVPMYIALKRLTPMAVLIGGTVFGGKKLPPPQVVFSVLLTVVGCLIAALGDLSFDPYAYAMALASVFFQTGHLLMVERSGGEEGLSSSELMMYNAVLSMPVLMGLLVITGEFKQSIPMLIEKCSASYSFTVIVTLTLFLGILLNFTMFLCTLVNSALTTTIVGVLKGVGSTALGFFVLGGVPIHPLNVTGLVINSLGGVWYSWAKYRQNQRKPRLEAEKEPLLPTSVPPRPVAN